MKRSHPFGTLANPSPVILRWVNRGEQDLYNKVEEYIRADKFTRRVFKRVVGEEGGDKTLICLLYVAVSFDLNAKRVKAKLTQAAGMSLRTLENFPKRLEAIAEEIAQVNSSLLGDLGDSLPRRSFAREYHAAESHLDLLAEYLYLPIALRYYAAFLGILTRRRKHGSREMKEKQVFNADWALYILREVIQATRQKPMYAEMAELLTATAHALGEHKEYYPDALKMRLRRKREAVSQKLLQRKSEDRPVDLQ
jgi:hypothetical protein